MIPARLVALLAIAALCAAGVTAATAGATTRTTRMTTTTADVYKVWLQPVNGSDITGTITIRDSGEQLRFSGRAWGLNREKNYTTLLYDVGSQPSGPVACLPNPVAPQPLSFDEMQVGVWQPIGQRTRWLPARRVGRAYVSMTRVGTMSIRRVDQRGPTTTLSLVACGAVRRVS